MDPSYRLRGADDREYGPASAAQVRDWIAQNRADASTRVQVDGGDWRPLAACPEFAEALAQRAAQAPPPPKPPSGSLVDQIVDEIRAHGYAVDLGGWLGRGWELFCRYPWLLVAMTALVLVIKFLLVFVPPGFVAGVLVWGPLTGGCQWLVLRLVRGQPAGLEMMFTGFQRAFVPLFVLGLIAVTLTCLGLVLCVIPGLYLLVVWGLFPYLLVIDRNLDFWPALELSLRVTHLHFWSLLLFVAVLLLVAALGLLGCGVGVLITLPWACAAIVYAYEDIFGHAWPRRA